tara:strand:- start:273 stop:416 length:144 start_codon:yes stop_codon:yes gene_type:complete
MLMLLHPSSICAQAKKTTPDDDIVKLVIQQTAAKVVLTSKNTLISNG